jgi:hypothetical protein
VGAERCRATSPYEFFPDITSGTVELTPTLTEAATEFSLRPAPRHHAERLARTDFGATTLGNRFVTATRWAGSNRIEADFPSA